MSRRTTQFDRSREWDGVLRFEYAAKPSKSGAQGTSDLVAELERVVRGQGERIARLEAVWSIPVDREHRRYTKQ